jgi:D-alanyl-D-alanine carboxypeptidase (penicillin-binding protein 5/6)
VATPATSRSTIAWPTTGQASYALDGKVFDSPDQTPVPIASVAKVMTAYVTVHHLSAGAQLVVDEGDVADMKRRRGRGESIVKVAAGEVLTRDQALTALLLPSANNVAAMLAERVSGHWPAFLRLMNRTARDLGMTDTTYTDPSGYQPSTVSTAHDQLLLLRAAMRSSTLARIMGKPSAYLPVAGVVTNTNSLLGRDGFVAGKTGSTSSAGGCLVFRVVRHGRTLDGAVLGQRGTPLISAGLAAASDLSSRALSPRADP